VQAENSDVFMVCKCVAVAVTDEPAGTAATFALKEAFPAASVVTINWPKNVLPSPNPLGSR